MSVLKPEQHHPERYVAGAFIGCPGLRNISSAPRLAEVPRRIMDHVLLWHGQLRVANLTDVDFLDPDDGIVYATGHYRGSAGEEYKHVLPAEEPVLGAIVWQTQRDGSWWTMLGWVEPHARRQGLYTELWATMVHLAKEAGVRRIQGGTAWHNKAMQATMEKLGRKPHSIIYDYEVER